MGGPAIWTACSLPLVSIKTLLYLCPGSWGRWQSGSEVLNITSAAGNPSGRGWKGGEGLGKQALV